MAFQITQSAVLYLFLMVAVIFLGLMIVGKGKVFLFSEGAKLSALFEHEIVHPIEGPVQEMVEVECENGQFTKIILKGMSFNYKGKEDRIEFVILLDMGKSLVIGQYDDGPRKKQTVIACELNDDNAMQCDPTRDYYFDLKESQMPLSELTSTYYHFTVWRKIPGLKLAGTTLKGMIERHFPYYLASFGVGGIVTDQKCQEFICKGNMDENRCNLNNRCYWHGGFLGIGSECRSCPVKDVCSEHNKGSCQNCKFSKENCEWFEGSCVPENYGKAEETCRKCMDDN